MAITLPANSKQSDRFLALLFYYIMIFRLLAKISNFKANVPKIGNFIQNAPTLHIHSAGATSRPAHLQSFLTQGRTIPDFQNKKVHTVLDKEGFQLGQSVRFLQMFKEPAVNIVVQAQKREVGLLQLGKACYKFQIKEKEPFRIKTIGTDCTNFDSAPVQISLEANILAREIANQRSYTFFPSTMADLANQVALQTKTDIKVLSKKEILAQKLNLLWAVGKGSQHQPRLINLTYKGDPSSDQYTALVGKGITFDTGGVNLKLQAKSLLWMHADKHGSASVLAAFRAAALLGLKINLTCTLAMAQNCLSGKAYKPGDVIASKKGLTIQITNTDAEGRLVLADAMTWTQQNYKVKNLLQYSTLTGGVIAALGNQTAGLFSNCNQLSKQLIEAGSRVRQNYFRMPITSQHRKLLKSKVADLANSGEPVASSSQGAVFLQRFVEKGVKWVHADIAGTASDKHNKATGFGSLSLVQYFKRQVNN